MPEAYASVSFLYETSRNDARAMLNETGQLPTLPHSCLCSTIGAEELNFRVRDGNGWVLLAMVTQKGFDLNIDGLAEKSSAHCAQ
jgi:hypothetical protein